jgi:hypothetical protein
MSDIPKPDRAKWAGLNRVYCAKSDALADLSVAAASAGFAPYSANMT